MVKIKFLDPTCTRRTWGIYRFGPDGLSLKSFPGEPEEYDAFRARSSSERKRLDLGVLNLMRSAERRRRFELVHVDGHEPQPKAAAAAMPPRKQSESGEDPRVRAKAQALAEKARADAAAREKAEKARYEAEHPEEREEREPAGPPDIIVSEATGLPLSMPALRPAAAAAKPEPPEAKQPAPAAQKAKAEPPPAKPAAPKGKTAKG